MLRDRPHPRSAEMDGPSQGSLISFYDHNSIYKSYRLHHEAQLCGHNTCNAVIGCECTEHCERPDFRLVHFTMDATGLSIAILGLITEITAAVDRAQSAPKEIRGVYDRLTTLKGCLAQFETLLRSSDASSAIKAHLQRWDEVVKGLSRDVNGLLGTIQELHDKLGGQGLKKLRAKMGFVVDRDKIRRLEGQLSTHIETLELLSGTLNV